LGRKKGGPPLGEGRLNAADDVIGTLSARVTELSKRVALLEAELQSAEKRIEIYEDHDSQIQDALSGALKAAYQIRQRAETAAEQILEQAREQRRMILSEIERLQDERDRLQDEIATGRRSSIAAVTTHPLSSDTAASELRAVASEALKGLFEEIVEDFRTTQARTVPPKQPTVEEAPDVPRAPQARREPPVVTHEDIETAAPTYEAMARMRRSTIEQEEIGAPAPMDEAPVAEPEPETPPAPIEELEEIAEPETMRPISEGPSMEERLADEERETERRAAELREIEERAEAERREAERREADERAEAERVAAEQRAAEERAAIEQRAAEERAAMERAVAEARASAERAAADRAAAERAQAEARAIEARVAAERAAMERAATERATAERAAIERAATERAAAERAAAERAAAERAALERAAAEYAAAERAAAERAAAEAARRAAPPLEVVRTPVDMGEIAPPRVEAASPTSDIQLVLSPVASFPRLVEIERQIQALDVVRTLYVRDFRGGAATLAVALRSSMTPEEFAGLLRGLQQPRLRLVAGSRNTLEMRVEGEAGVA
jgi:hypothetical protein